MAKGLTQSDPPTGFGGSPAHLSGGTREENDTRAIRILEKAFILYPEVQTAGAHCHEKD